MTRSPSFWFQTLLVTFLCMEVVTAQPLDQNTKNTAFDIVIANGTVLDGSGLASFKADIGLHGDTIAAIGDLSDFPRSRTIDAAKLFVAPGFVDMHNHSDQTLLDEPRCESMIRQGVTTMVLGEGNSMGPVKAGSQPWTTLGGYFKHIEKQGVATNVCSYVGQSQIWTYVKGYELEPATDTQLEAMKQEVALAMQDGAWGLSTSLMTPPADLVTTEQLIELAKVARTYGGIYSTHTRDEGEEALKAYAEAITVGKGANIKVDLIHLKISHKDHWGRMPEVIALIEQARADGYDIQSHVYPYTAGQDNLRSIIPPWAHDGGVQDMLERLRNPELYTRIRKDVLQGLPGWYNHYLATGSWEGMLLVSLSAPRNKPFVGKRMSELIASRGGDDPVKVLFDVLIEEGGSVPTVFFHHTEPDMQLAMKQPFTSIGSDGSAISLDGPYSDIHPHPRWYGTFPRVLGRYVRELGVLKLPEAIHKMTSLNAQKIGIRDRGLLRVGYKADITIFDPAEVIDLATYENPHKYPTGIPYVVVNGEIVLDNGQHTGALPGQVLRGPGYRNRR